VAERIVRCHVDRFLLSPADNYELHPAKLAAKLATAAYDLLVIVNPNSPTGRHVGRRSMENFLALIPARTRIWLDETYVDYAGPCESLETFAASSRNLVVCKSMSKVYALSGARAAYLCAPPDIASELLEITPPWAVSLPAQVAAVRALEDPEYYADRYRDTHLLRESLAACLQDAGFQVVPGVANFLLCKLPAGFSAAAVSLRCRLRGLYVRDGAEISQRLGTRALRIAVKDERTNLQTVEILKWAMLPPADTLPS
jgi:histidinol-phosphate/aromatic aminotransferase/cobyric acid decarboxylase-like protein